jgi:hypothetical protein
MSELTRRALLRGLAAAAVAASRLDALAGQEVHRMMAEQSSATGAPYRPKALTSQQYATLDCLTDLIIPAEGASPGARAADAAAWIDMLAAENVQLLAIYSDGLRALDEEMKRRTTRTFVEASEGDRRSLLDAIAFKKNQPTELVSVARFFDWAHGMTVDAIYTSRVGIEALGYKGNLALNDSACRRRRWTTLTSGRDLDAAPCLYAEISAKAVLAAVPVSRLFRTRVALEDQLKEIRGVRMGLQSACFTYAGSASTTSSKRCGWFDWRKLTSCPNTSSSTSARRASSSLERAALARGHADRAAARHRQRVARHPLRACAPADQARPVAGWTRLRVTRCAPGASTSISIGIEPWRRSSPTQGLRSFRTT